ncbi:MAG: DMT family transporter [Gammaproteobacteria bacterium]|nr:DMT family transporter [Gammaproteobacteria bacterium]
MYLSDNARGILLVAVGVLLLSPDSLLIRLIDIDLWTLTFLRGTFMALTLFGLNLILYNSKALHQFTGFDKYAWGIVLLMAGGTLLFVSSIQTTSVAHTLIIIGAVPVVSAVLGWLVLRQAVSGHMRWAIIIVVISLGFVVYDDSQSSLLGDFYAMVTCMFLAINFIFAHKTRVTNMLAPMSVSGVLVAFCSLPLADLPAIGSYQVMLGIVQGALVGVALTMINMAPKYIPNAEVALFMPTEAVLGSLLVWWFLGEYPGLVSIIAGLVIVVVLMLNSYLQLRPQKA